ncbi:MAG: AAA family ATPase [Oceanospirillales bacterium]|nr:AAA family ATPase [Oceanospirillales bacterium]MBR9886766.1 AAA family ATPase [Oceanospirillales bacterium]
MITQIDIANFRSFDNFTWKTSFRDGGNNVQDLKRLNIIYGRNYSGKTTLSRIFRSLQTSQLPSDYSNPSFIVYGDKGNVDQTNISNHNYDIRVYNSDFVSDNPGFLVDKTDGEIKTFAIVGEKNKEIEDSIGAYKQRGIDPL